MRKECPKCHKEYKRNPDYLRHMIGSAINQGYEIISAVPFGTQYSAGIKYILRKTLV